MARQIQIRRGSSADHENFTGAVGEITMDTDKKTLRIHDGETAGDITLARTDQILQSQTLPDNYDFVVETFNRPDAWYRKYKSGWIEQGGIVSIGSLGESAAGSAVVQLIFAMSDSGYHVQTNATSDNSNYHRLFSNYGECTSTGFKVGVRNMASTTSGIKIAWIVFGYMAT